MERKISFLIGFKNSEPVFCYYAGTKTDISQIIECSFRDVEHLTDFALVPAALNSDEEVITKRVLQAVSAIDSVFCDKDMDWFMEAIESLFLAAYKAGLNKA